MTENTCHIDASATDVWDVLADGWLYPLWVVGASRIRDVDPMWPAESSKIYHSVGVWPALIDDHTDVLSVEPGQSLRLRARAWPLGEADVLLTIAPVDGRTEVCISEEVVAGPGTIMPRQLTNLGLKWRNTETLRRLSLLVEGRARRDA